MGVEENKEKNQYLMSDLEKEADQERLSLQEQTWDPITFRNLEMIGVSQGWKCLEVGAGYGSVTSWLAERVGLNGKVVATDIRAELHREVSKPIEIRQHNILKDELEKDYYDLAHCRMVLQHIPEPEVALSRMAEAVKPGGWLLVEEMDNAMMTKFDPNDPKADFYYRTSSKMQDMAKQLGADTELGRRLRMLLDRMGFNEVGGQGNVLLARGSESWAKSSIYTQEAGYNRFLDLKLVTEEEANEVKKQLRDLLEDPDFYYTTPPLCCAWGRKPK